MFKEKIEKHVNDNLVLWLNGFTGLFKSSSMQKSTRSLPLSKSGLHLCQEIRFYVIEPLKYL